MRTPRASGLAGLAALASLLAFASPREAQEGLQVSDAEVRALVLALKDKPIDRAQHDLLVALGERAATSDEALTGDLLFSGWALVAADRPLLGYPLILETLERPPLLASAPHPWKERTLHVPSC